MSHCGLICVFLVIRGVEYLVLVVIFFFFFFATGHYVLLVAVTASFPAPSKIMVCTLVCSADDVAHIPPVTNDRVGVLVK